MNISDFLRQLLEPTPFASPQTQVTPRPQQSPPDMFSPSGAPIWFLEEANGPNGFYAVLGRNGGSQAETLGWEIYIAVGPRKANGVRDFLQIRKFSFLDEALAAWDDLCAGTDPAEIKDKEYAV